MLTGVFPLNVHFPAEILRVGGGFVSTRPWFNVPMCACQATNKPVEWWSEEEERLVKLIYVVWEWPRICGAAVNNFHVVEKKRKRLEGAR